MQQKELPKVKCKEPNRSREKGEGTFKARTGKGGSKERARTAISQRKGQRKRQPKRSRKGQGQVARGNKEAQPKGV
jgi:hypothetical protein